MFIARSATELSILFEYTPASSFGPNFGSGEHFGYIHDATVARIINASSFRLVSVYHHMSSDVITRL